MYVGLRKNKSRLGGICLLFLLSLLSSNGKAAVPDIAQNIISGSVFGSDGTALEGVQVRNLQTNAVTVTVSGGSFKISGDPGDQLEFKLIGYETRVITASEAERVVLAPVAMGLNEVVVVGYGTQKKQNLTGAVSNVNFNKSTISRPAFNLSSTLTGLVPGLNISQSSATPGAEGFNILIRGQGTMNDASPLVLIDGVPGALNSIPPYDVESVTVLKDASSSSIYGSRAANGVILVTTKKGSSGKLKVSYNTYLGEQSTAKNISFITDMATHMKLVNESEGFDKYSADLIQNWENKSKAGDPLYPNTDWYKEMLKPSFLQQHNLSVSGGAEKINYYMSLGYLDNKGVIDNSGFRSYSFRLNSEAKPTSWLSIGEKISGSWSNRAPIDMPTFFGNIRNTTPGVIPKYTDGRYGGEMFNGLPQGNNPRAYVDNIRGNFEGQNLDLQLFGTISFLKYFKWENNFGLNYRNRRNWTYARPYSLWNFQNDFNYPLRPNVSSLFNGSIRNYTTVYNSLLRFNQSFTGGHNLSALLGFGQEYNRMDAFDAKKNDILGDDVIYILDAGTNMESINGSGTDDALRSYFGRINYDFKNKYLFEANARYDGSSRFSGNNRWGFFPSFSAGWRISEEPFAHSLDKIFDNIKLRASWGTLGNNRIGDYTYQVTYGPILYPFGGQLQQAVAPKDLANKDIKWETTRITNIGLDLGIMNNRLSLSIDYFDKVTSDILTRIPIPLVMGNFLPPWQNIAKMKNTGVEIQVTYQDRIGEKLSYGINGNISTINNKVLKFNGNKSINGPNVTIEESPFNSFYVLEFDRIIQDQSEVDKLLSEGYSFGAYVGGKPGPGDILYKDSNEDKIFDDKDRVIKSYSPLPKYTYGLSLNVAYKGIDLNVMGQGVGGVEGYWGNDGFNTFNINEGFLQRSVILNRWTPENKSTQYPRLRTSGSALNTVYSDYWLYNTSYFRIKSLQLGYTLPEALITKAHISDLRIYMELENYFTFTKFSGYNPENSSMAYPLMKQIVFGLNLTF